MKFLTATAWTNGDTGFGLKLSKKDRDAFFKETWDNIQLYLPQVDYPISINVKKPSFCNKTCRELIHKEIGIWLKNSGNHPWPKGKPPKISLEILDPETGIFRISE